MLVDANLLLYAVDETSPHHERSARWWTDALNGERRVALPMQTIGAFLRIITHPRILESPLSASDAWDHVKAWLASDPVWIPPTSARTARLLGELIGRYGVTGNLVPDAQLAALAIEHGLSLVSADTDFARFTELRWENPIA